MFAVPIALSPVANAFLRTSQALEEAQQRRQRRAERITVSALNAQGQPFTLEAEGLLAVCIQHEMDHLRGKVFVEYLSPLKRDRIKTKMLKKTREEQRGQ